MISFLNLLFKSTKPKTKDLTSDEYWEQYSKKKDEPIVETFDFCKFEKSIEYKLRDSTEVTDETIRELAYFKWEEAGRPECDGIHFWEMAKKELVR